MELYQGEAKNANHEIRQLVPVVGSAADERKDTKENFPISIPTPSMNPLSHLSNFHNITPTFFLFHATHPVVSQVGSALEFREDLMLGVFS